MDDKSNTRFGAIEHYSYHMEPYFNPLVIVGQVLIQMDLNPRIIKNLWVDFKQQEEPWAANVVKVVIDLNFPMSDSWIEHMKGLLSRYLKDAFLRAYNKKTEVWFSEYEKEAPPFLKEAGIPIRKVE